MSHGRGKPPTNRSWGDPECPGCDSDVFVTKSSSNKHDYTCHHCGGRWSA